MANCYFTEFIKGALDSGNVVGAVFLDLKKAFATVNHKILIHKMNMFSFFHQAINWFRSYLEARDQCVNINNARSSLQNIEMGLPQGSILGPLLFSLYINDLANCCKETKCQLDDSYLCISTDFTLSSRYTNK
ncbi:hypothetical protein H4Q32_010617 [Labeo rohita]|uniref:Reverse transcriptase domain-containing protein n=1 Tax=Labeo rohita TaxID=84645 RepID=A0ABQ8MVS4_LABRO|nr:hypothetical protein H4Q32_010617 [Labeo rohita]